MRASIPLVLSGVSGAILGFSVATVLPDRGLPGAAPLALRPASDVKDGPQDAGAPSTEGVSPDGNGPGRQATAADDPAWADNGARTTELRELRARARAAQEQLAAAHQRIAQLEKERDAPASTRPKRARREFDLTTEDWRQMAAQGVMKYRLPCDSPPPSDEVLDQLGLAPDDREVMRQAFEHSAARLRNAVLPLCAAALGDRLEAAQEMSTDACRRVVLSTASERAESPPLSAKSVASFMAGDAPRPGDNAPLSERLFLVLAEEAKHIEDELAESFGPEEAHRLIFSDRLCFRTATHSFTAPRNAGFPQAEAR
jgi:hypothetical protein